MTRLPEEKKRDWKEYAQIIQTLFPFVIVVLMAILTFGYKDQLTTPVPIPLWAVLLIMVALFAKGFSR